MTYSVNMEEQVWGIAMSMFSKMVDKMVSIPNQDGEISHTQIISLIPILISIYLSLKNN